MTHRAACVYTLAWAIALLITGPQVLASDLVRPVRVQGKPNDEAAQQDKAARVAKAASAAAAASAAKAAVAARPAERTYSKEEIEAAIALSGNLKDLAKLSPPAAQRIQDVLAYKKAQDQAAAAAAAADKAAKEAEKPTGDGECDPSAPQTNNKCQLGATGLAPEVALTTAKSSKSATVKVYKTYINTGGSTYRPLWLNTTLPVNGPIGKDAVVQSLLNPDAGLVNLASTPLSSRNGDYIRPFNHQANGLCGFPEKPEFGCFGYMKMGVKVIQAPVSDSNEYARPWMAYISSGAYINFPLYASQDNKQPTVGNLSLGLSGMFGMVDAKKFDYVFGERIKRNVGAVIFDASFKLTDVVSVAYSATAKSYPHQVGRTHSFTLNVETK